MIPTQHPSFRSANFLAQHIQSTMNFYHPRAIDPKGGFSIISVMTAASTIVKLGT